MRSLLVGLLAWTACQVRNPDWCDAQNPCADGRSCDVDGHFGLKNTCLIALPDARGCTGEADCVGRGHCGAGGACVECRNGDDCPASKPVCGSGSTCSACVVDTDCPDLCDEATGGCVAAGDILYVSLGSTGTCAKASPCGGIGIALGKVTAGRKKWIVVGAGSYSESMSIGAIEVEIVGPSAVVVPRLVADNLPGAHVLPGANVTFRGLRFSGATGTSMADGVLCDGTLSAPAQVTLRQVTLDRNDHLGLDAQNCQITMERSLVTKNFGGGIALVSSDFELTNNYVVGNGGATAPFGGIEIDRDPPSASATLAFNTIADNSAPGVKCNDLSMALAFANDIVFDNGSMQVVNAGTACAFTFSDIGPMKYPGMGNLEGDPKFLNPTAGNYGLKTDSPCINAADPAATVTVDYDGDARPAGGRADIGADEAR